MLFSVIEEDVASVSVSFNKSGVISVAICNSQGPPVASMPDACASEGGVASVHVIYSKGGMASVSISLTEGGVASVHMSVLVKEV